jgi:hypothetical protein
MFRQTIHPNSQLHMFYNLLYYASYHSLEAENKDTQDIRALKL